VKDGKPVPIDPRIFVLLFQVPCVAFWLVSHGLFYFSFLLYWPFHPNISPLRVYDFPLWGFMILHLFYVGGIFFIFLFSSYMILRSMAYTFTLVCCSVLYCLWRNLALCIPYRALCVAHVGCLAFPVWVFCVPCVGCLGCMYWTLAQPKTKVIFNYILLKSCFQLMIFKFKNSFSIFLMCSLFKGFSFLQLHMFTPI
jgi:hypothetical protein